MRFGFRGGVELWWGSSRSFLTLPCQPEMLSRVEATLEIFIINKLIRLILTSAVRKDIVTCSNRETFDSVLQLNISSMATRTLESRFERMSVNDENDIGDGSKYQKAKV